MAIDVVAGPRRVASSSWRLLSLTLLFGYLLDFFAVFTIAKGSDDSSRALREQDTAQCIPKCLLYNFVGLTDKLLFSLLAVGSSTVWKIILYSSRETSLIVPHITAGTVSPPCEEYLFNAIDAFGFENDDERRRPDRGIVQSNVALSLGWLSMRGCFVKSGNVRRCLSLKAGSTF